jgi:hypothetical protein
MSLVIRVLTVDSNQQVCEDGKDADYRHHPPPKWTSDSLLLLHPPLFYRRQNEKLSAECRYTGRKEGPMRAGLTTIITLAAACLVAGCSMMSSGYEGRYSGKVTIEDDSRTEMRERWMKEHYIDEREAEQMILETLAATPKIVIDNDGTCLLEGMLSPTGETGSWTLTEDEKFIMVNPSAAPGYGASQPMHLAIEDENTLTTGYYEFDITFTKS